MWERFKIWLWGPRCAWCRRRLAWYDVVTYTTARQPVYDADDDGYPVHRSCYEEDRNINKLIRESDNSRYPLLAAFVPSERRDPPRPPAPQRGLE